ncbi:hypothetical protein TNCV_71501 [Trichonephila clavipes]|nr:hypothetical protein TNCV_71501 [Trichonephila clavipes]
MVLWNSIRYSYIKSIPSKTLFKNLALKVFPVFKFGLYGRCTRASSGRSSLVVKVLDSWHEFEPSIGEDPPLHFWLNGYVNKQNCRIWSEANPQVYVETPLHPEKLTVWCALWAGGILLQKR